MEKVSITYYFWCIILFISLLLFAMSIHAGNTKVVKSDPTGQFQEDSVYADSTVQTLFNLVYQKPDSARSIAVNLLNNFSEHPMSLRVRLLNIVAISYHFQANYGKALEYYYYALERAIEINDSTRIGNIYNNLGLNSLNTGNYKDAYDFFLKALEQYEELGQLRNISSARHNIGLMFMELNNFERAKENFHLALEGFTETKDSIAITNTLNNIGAVSLKEGEYDAALEFFSKSFEIASDLNYLRGLCILHQGKAKIYSKRELFVDAIWHYNRSMEIAKEIQQPFETARIKHGLASIYNSQGNHTMALDFAYDALEIAIRTGNQVLEYECYEILSQTYEWMNDFSKSLKYFKKYNNLKAELLNQTVVHQVYNLEVSNLSQANKFKELEIERQELIIRNKNNTILFIGIAFALAVIGLYLLYLSFRYKQLSKLQQTIVNLKERRAKAALEAEIKERTRIGTELHDSLGQMLSATRLQLEVLQQRKQLPEDRVKQLIDTSIHSLDEAFVELRSISNNLAPTLLAEKGLAEALKNLADRINQSKKFHVNLEMFGMDTPLDELIEHSLFRIIQELINNTIKHANASCLNIQLIRSDSEITLMAEDNGCGFELNDPKINNKGGLHSIKSRVENLNCSLFIDSMIGRGTIVSVVLPLIAQKNVS
jgi:two-component system, NarL family, sensor kinase